MVQETRHLQWRIETSSLVIALLPTTRRISNGELKQYRRPVHLDPIQRIDGISNGELKQNSAILGLSTAGSRISNRELKP